ncbi:MAG TPA: carbohydrate kinase family protein [Patescibacteria group bacterium]|nr:carbohydrate kinase family protein [Patescibacteria group bacterium]
MSKGNQLVVTGSIAQDNIYILPKLLSDYIQFGDEHKISISVLSETHRKHWGGTGANIAYTAALLGDHPILLGSVGKHDKAYIEALEKVGVNTVFVHYSDDETAMFTVFTDKANNQIGSFGGGAMFDAKSLTIPKTQNIFVVISAHDPLQMLAQVNECAERKIPFCFDIGQQALNVSVEMLTSGLSYCEILIANDYEMDLIAKRVKRTKEGIFANIPLCITTFGAEGSVITGMRAAKAIPIPVAKPERVIDPTGAGDAYRAGFFHGYLADKPLEVCGRLGSVAASFAVEQHGGQEHKFTLEQFNKRYEENFEKESYV